jgi:hypothetical protein
MTWGGETANSSGSKIQVFRTDDDIPPETPFAERYRLMSSGEEITSAEAKNGPEMLTATVLSVFRFVSSTLSWPMMSSLRSRT